MIENILRAIAIAIVAFIIWVILKVILTGLGVVIPAIVFTLLGWLIVVLVIIYLIRLFRVKI